MENLIRPCLCTNVKSQKVHLLNLRFNKVQQKGMKTLISNKLVLWYLNHISTMERERERENNIVQVKPDYSRDVLRWNIYSIRAHNMDGFFCAKEKPHIPWMDGWMMGVNRSGGNKGEIRAKNEGILIRLLMSLPPFLQLCRCRKETKQAEANLRSASFTLLHRSPVGGDRCSWRREPHMCNLKSLKPRLSVWGGHRKVCGNHFGIRSQGKEDNVFKVCAKILVRLLLEHEPFFCTFSVCFSSDLKCCNIASSLILLLFHLLLVFHLFLIYIYICFSGFFFSFLTLQNERQNDGQLTIYIIIFLFLLSSGFC